MSAQLEQERRLVGDAGTKTLIKEMLTIPSNRKRALISVMLMICQQMTGVNAIVGPPLHPTVAGFIFATPGTSTNLKLHYRTITLLRFSRTLA